MTDPRYPDPVLAGVATEGRSEGVTAGGAAGSLVELVGLVGAGGGALEGSSSSDPMSRK